MVRFMLSSALALVLVAGVSLYWCSHVALGEALRRAESTGTGIAERIIAPKITSQLRQGDPKAMQELDDAVRARKADGSIYRIKVWTPEATGKTAKVLYSDETPLIGESYPIEPKDQALFGTKNASAVLSHLDREENEFEAKEGKLVEVYAGFEGADGKPLLFEAYFPSQPVEA